MYGFSSPSSSLQLQNEISGCIDDVAAWMRSNKLQLNTTKTEIVWSTTGRHYHQLSQSPLRVGSDYTSHNAPASVVRDLGIYLDSDVSVRSHVAKTVSACMLRGTLRQLWGVRRSLPRSVLQTLIRHLSCHDWTTETTLTGIPSYLLQQLQTVTNSAVRLVFSSSSYDRITPVLRQLRWLKAPQRIHFKVAVFVHK